MEMLSRVHAQNLVQWAADKPRVLVLSADLTSSVEVRDFREAYPDRFISMGVAEQNMLSFAGGLAREGYFPFIHTFAVFIYRRPLDQLQMSIAYPNLPAVLEVLAEHHPELQAKIIPDAGHWVMFEQADAFNAALTEMLRD